MLQLSTKAMRRTFYVSDLVQLYKRSTGAVGSEAFVESVLERAGMENSWSVPNMFAFLTSPKWQWGQCIEFSQSVTVSVEGKEISVMMEIEDYTWHTANAITGVAFVVCAEDAVDSLLVNPDTVTPQYMAEVPFEYENKDYVFVMLGNDY